MRNQVVAFPELLASDGKSPKQEMLPALADVDLVMARHRATYESEMIYLRPGFRQGGVSFVLVDVNDAAQVEKLREFVGLARSEREA